MTINVLDDALETELDNVLNAENDARAGLLPATIQSAERVLDYCMDNPLLDFVDHNEFTPDLEVVGPMRAQIGEILNALGK
ncbi:MAG: hypothetical protein AB3N09_00245 [Tateyamaria sp.]